MRILGTLAVGISLACGPVLAPPPATITVDPELPAGVLLAASRSRDAWCAAPVGWCPELVDAGGEAELVVEAFLGKTDAARMSNDHHGTVKIQPDVADWTADEITGQLTHEFGHFGIEGHVEDSALMTGRFEKALDIPRTVDAAAATEWCRQQGC